jgi:hypothetical protein
MILKKFPVLTLFNREFGGDGFAVDCVHRQFSKNKRTKTIIYP